MKKLLFILLLIPVFTGGQIPAFRATNTNFKSIEIADLGDSPLYPFNPLPSPEFRTLNLQEFNPMLLGWNTTNMWENINPTTLALIDAMIPDGKQFVFRIRNDKYGKMPDQIIDNIIQAANYLGDKFKAIYTFDTRGVSIADNFYGYDRLNNVINFMASEFGNEEFYPSAGHNQLWSAYQVFVMPIITALNSRGATEDFLFPIAPRPKGFGIAKENSFHTAWNEPAIVFINTSAQYKPAFHLYWDKSDMAAWVDSIPLVVLTGFNQVKNDFFRTITEQFFTSTLLQKTMDYFYAKLPDKVMYVTESGPVDNPSGYQNTMSYGFMHAWFLDELSKYERVACVIKHAGLNTTPAGQLTDHKQMDANPNAWIERLGYYVMKMYLFFHDDHTFYMNMSATDNQTGELKVAYITAKYWYSSSGYCSWWAKGSTASYEVAGYSEETLTKLPAFSFGYHKEVCEKLTWYRDGDADSYGGNETLITCEEPAGYVLNSLDCDDDDNTTYPGAFEACNSFDDDCDGLIDEGYPVLTIYQDDDEDGYGDGNAISYCVIPPGFADKPGDCEDENPNIHPNAIDTCGNDIDEDCSGGDLDCPDPVTCWKKTGLWWLHKKCKEIPMPSDPTKCNCPNPPSQ